MPADRQLPEGEEIFLDHVAHFVPDAGAAAAALGRAGFATTPVSIQEAPDASGRLALTGTGNTTAMLARGYVEVLFKTAATPLGREFDAALARHAGVHLAAFAVADAAAAHGRLVREGFRVRPLAAMQRPVSTGNGEGTASFTVARVEPGEMAEGRIQILAHHTEEMVWQPRWLAHPNGAHALRGVVIAVADVDEAAARFARFTGRPARADHGGRIITLDRGQVQIVSAQGFAELVPGIAIPSLPFMGAYTVAVRSLADAARLLREGGLTAAAHGDCLLVPFPDALGRGAWVLVEER